MRYRLALGLVLALAGCSDGGSDVSSVPVLPWGSFRHDGLNTSVGGGILNNLAEGADSPLIDAEALGGVTTSTPAIDSNGHIYIGTESGVASFDADGALRWRATQCAPTGGGAVVPIGRVTSSPTVTPGDVIVFGSDPVDGSAGAVFAIKQNSSNEITCLWAFRPTGASADFAVRSSPITQVDAIDLSLLSVLIGTSDGQLLAINGDGTLRWAYPSVPTVGDVSSSPALTAGGVAYVTTPAGTFAAIDFSGRLVWQASIGRPPEAGLQPSPSVITTAYAVGGSSSLFGINPDGTLKWQYPPDEPLSGSLGVLSLSFDQGADSVFDTIVYTVSTDGLIAGVRDSNGMAVVPQRCVTPPPTPGPTPSPTPRLISCRMDSCAVAGLGTCNPGTNRCDISNIECTVDSCLPSNGTCTALSEPFYVSGSIGTQGNRVPVSTSLVVSADQFVVVGTDTGQLCARGLDGNVPDNANVAGNPWSEGCVTLGQGLPVRSSPAIGRQGAIFITTDEGLFVVQ